MFTGPYLNTTLVYFLFLLAKKCDFSIDFLSQGQEVPAGSWDTCGLGSGPSKIKSFVCLSSNLPDGRTEEREL